MNEQTITAVAMSVTSHRCHYYTRAEVRDDAVPGDGSGTGQHWKHARWPVLGWAAVGPTLHPVRLEERTGRGVLCGTEDDPLHEDFLGCLVAGAGLDELGPEVDALIRERNVAAAHKEVEVDDDSDED